MIIKTFVPPHPLKSREAMSRRDDTILTVDFNLRRQYDARAQQSPARTTLVMRAEYRSCGTCGERASLLRRWLMPLLIALMFSLTSCDKEKDTVKKIETDEAALELASSIFWCLNNLYTKVPNGFYGKVGDVDTGNPSYFRNGFESGRVEVRGYKRRRYVPTGTYTQKTVDDCEFVFDFENYAEDDRVTLKNGEAFFAYNYETSAASSTKLPETTEYRLFSCDFTMNSITMGKYAGTVSMVYETLGNENRTFRAVIEIEGGKTFAVGGRNW